MTWIPTPIDVQWAKGMLSMMNDGGIWAIPMNGQIIRFNHTMMRLELISGPDDPNMDMMNTETFARHGYSFLDMRK